MAKNKSDKMTETELLTLLDAKIDAGIGAQGGEITNDRQDLLDFYMGELYGNERDGYSSVVTREVLETVEWIKPTLLRMFFSSDTVVEFDPVSPNPKDELQAKQETEYCNYVFNKENKGFIEGYNWITDALLQRVGVMKVWRDKTINVSHETYENLNDEELVELVDSKNGLDDKEYETEVTGHKFNEDGTLDVEITTKHTVEKTMLQTIPPEDFINDSQHRELSLENTRFCCHRRPIQKAELVAMGYDESLVDDLSVDESPHYEDEKINRNDKTDEQYFDSDRDAFDDGLVYEECYIRIDYDGDGIEELLQVNKVNKTVLEVSIADHIPFASLCSLPIPHKYSGLCVADLVKDIQLIRSTLLRMMLDGMYQANNPRILADEANCEISDLLNPASGQVVRGKAGSVSVIPTQADEVISTVLPALQTLEDIKESRTGISRIGRGLDPDVIAEATKGAFDRGMDSAQDRVEMIARIFAETGFTELFKLIRKIGIMSDDSKDIKLGQEWVNVNPRSWKERNNMTVSVGLGSNSKENEIKAISAVISKQEQYMATGSRLVDETKMFNSLSKLIEATGLKSPNLYFNDVTKMPPPEPPPPDPLMVSIEKEFEVEMAKIDQKDRESFLDNVMKMIKLEVENQVDLGPEGLGVGVNDGQQRETEANAASYASSASPRKDSEGEAGGTAQQQPPAP